MTAAIRSSRPEENLNVYIRTSSIVSFHVQFWTLRVLCRNFHAQFPNASAPAHDYLFRDARQRCGEISPRSRGARRLPYVLFVASFSLELATVHL